MTASKKKNQGLSMAGVYESRKLIARLSVNDFKTKFAGSYLGIIWAFVQPVITILVYWFVFEKGMKPVHLSLKGFWYRRNDGGALSKADEKENKRLIFAVPEKFGKDEGGSCRKCRMVLN